jgi:hypothetical protein
MKQKIEIEIEIPEGMEIVKTTEHNSISIFSDKMSVNMLVYLRDIEPPLELETHWFVENEELESDKVFLCRQGRKLKLAVAGDEFEPAAVRDLAKILNYWAKNGKLPERVVVNSLPKQGGE